MDVTVFQLEIRSEKCNHQSISNPNCKTAWQQTDEETSTLYLQKVILKLLQEHMCPPDNFHWRVTLKHHITVQWAICLSLISSSRARVLISANAELNSSIPFASFKSTVDSDEARLCTSTSKHRRTYVQCVCAAWTWEQACACAGF